MSIVVDGRKVFTGEVSFQNDVQIDGDLIVTGAESYTGDNSFTGVVTIAGQLDVTGPFNLIGDMTQTGDTEITGGCDVLGVLYTNDDFEVDGLSVFNDSVQIVTGDFEVSAGATTLTGDVTVTDGTVDLAAAADELIVLTTSGTGYVQMNLGSGGLVVDDGGPGTFAIATGTGLVYTPVANDDVTVTLSGTGIFDVTSGSGGVELSCGGGPFTVDGASPVGITATRGENVGITTSAGGEVIVASETAINLNGATTVDNTLAVTGSVDFQSSATITGQIVVESTSTPSAGTLKWIPYVVYHNVTAAEVNAGHTVLPTDPDNGNYRIFDWGIAARGGAAADVTSLVLEDTDDNEIATIPVAALTQNEQVGPNTANVAGGSSSCGYICGSGEGIRIIKVGSDVTGATSFDIWIMYALVPQPV